jgi:hypothetical protein
MPCLIEPAACPSCGEPFRATYQDRRHAHMPVHAKLILIVAMTFTVIALPTFFTLAVSFMADITDTWNLLRREKRLLNGLVGLCSVPFSLLPAIIAWRYSFSRPGRLAIPCRKCDWLGECTLIEVTPETDEH